MPYLAKSKWITRSRSFKRHPAPTRIALGPRAGQKVLSLQTLFHRRDQPAPALCANAHGFSLHAAVRCAAAQRSQLEHLCRLSPVQPYPMNGSDAIALTQLYCKLEECLQGWHYPRRDLAAGIHAAALCTGAAHDWKMAMNQFAILYQDRFTRPQA